MTHPALVPAIALRATHTVSATPNSLRIATRSACASGLDRRRGCANGTSKVAWMRVGRGDSTMMRSARWMASSTSCVISRTVWRSFAQDAQQLVAHAQAHQRVERRERLVHVEDLGLHHQRARQLRALEHAAGEFVRIAVLEALQADHLGVVVGERLAVRQRRPARPNIRFCCTVSHGNTEPCCEIRMPLRVGLGARLRRRRARRRDRAQEAGDDVHQRGLAAARRARRWRRTRRRPPRRLMSSRTCSAPCRSAKLLPMSSTCDLSGHNATARLSAFEQAHQAIQQQADQRR